MKRRIFSICLVLGFLAFALVLLTAPRATPVQAQALTATLTRTPIPCGAIIVVTSTLTPTMTATPTRTATATATACGPRYITATPGAPVITATVTPTPTGNTNQPDLVYPVNAYWAWDQNAYDSANGCYNYVPVLVWNVQVKNAGNVDAGSFVVNQSYSQQQTVPGLPAGQTITLYFSFPGGRGTAPAGQPTLPANMAGFMADYTNLVVESNETNNTTLQYLPTFTATPYSGATRVFCKAGTPGTPTPTLTPTRTLTPSRTPTGPTPTITRSPTKTPTTGPTLCSPTTTIAAPFTQDGAGAYCWQSTNLGTYINSWNLTSLMINFTDYTNQYIAAGSLTPKLNGYWYVSYNSAASYGHFETK